ncbi:AI-2E family transporter [Micromonospora sp. NPDC049102]|uniref:AI-2E family transporter n=1 Tax=Micromonospora sp. NPDC049102 TaxID=3364265 RepID=UPI00372444CD
MRSWNAPGYAVTSPRTPRSCAPRAVGCGNPPSGCCAASAGRARRSARWSPPGRGSCTPPPPASSCSSSSSYQQVENHLLQPLICARAVRLNPLTVLLSLLLAAELAGLLGALLAIPAAGIVQILLPEYAPRRSSATARRDLG